MESFVRRESDWSQVDPTIFSNIPGNSRGISSFKHGRPFCSLIPGTGRAVFPTFLFFFFLPSSRINADGGQTTVTDRVHGLLNSYEFEYTQDPRTTLLRAVYAKPFDARNTIGPVSYYTTVPRLGSGTHFAFEMKWKVAIEVADGGVYLGSNVKRKWRLEILKVARFVYVFCLKTLGGQFY